MTDSDTNAKSERSIPDVPWTLTARHLIVCQHGLLGSEKDFSQVVMLFQTHLSTKSLYIHSAESNASSIFKTYDGIDQGGNRLADEIQEIAKQMANLEKFSFIGHSMGGLYGRYCMGVLFSRGFFDRVQACVRSGWRRLLFDVMNWFIEFYRTCSSSFWSKKTEKRVLECGYELDGAVTIQ